MTARKAKAAARPARSPRARTTTASHPAAWAALSAHCQTHKLGKPQCVGRHGEAFGGLRTHGDVHEYPFGIEEVLLLEGEKVRDHLHGKKQKRKGADCVFFLLFKDGTIRVVIVELKTGNDDEAHFTLQLKHSEQDCAALATKLRIAEPADFFFGAPRLPDTVRGGRKGFQKKFEDRFDVASDLSNLLDKMRGFFEDDT